MPKTTPTAATLADLHQAGGKAELIAGKVVALMPTGHRPGQIGGRIYRAIDDYAASTGRGSAYPDNVGFAVPELASGRESFSPDAAYYLGPAPPDDMDFLPGPPALAVEVRSKGDYGEAAEDAMAAKRADYFEAGTAVVWDVDPIAGVIRVYRASAPDRPDVFGRGASADAEPAMPGWRLAVDTVLA
jgi:Uma2 family endonuclease